MLVADDALSYSLLNIGNCIVFVGASSTETRSIECMSFVGSSVYVRHCFSLDVISNVVMWLMKQEECLCFPDRIQLQTTAPTGCALLN